MLGDEDDCRINSYLIDVSNRGEFALFIIYCIIDIAFILKAANNIRMIRKWIISQQKKEQKLLLVMLAVLVAYICVFIGQLTQLIYYHTEQHLIEEVILYYILIYCYIYLINIVIYSTCILWLQVIWQHKIGTPFARYIRYLQYLTGVLIFISTVNLILDSFFFTFCKDVNKYLPKISSGVTLVVIILAAMVQTICIILFYKTIFKFRVIARKTKSLITLYSISIIFCFCIRIIWDALLFFEETKQSIDGWRSFKENVKYYEDERFYWLIYLMVYIPTTFYIPSLLILNLYTPRGCTITPISSNQSSEAFIKVPGVEKNIQTHVFVSTEDTDFDNNFH